MDYNQVASSYDRRYQINPLSGVALVLQKLAGRISASSALEVGCGTGHWLQELQAAVPFVCGMDISTGMLAQARRRSGAFGLLCGSAWQLPLQERCIDSSTAFTLFTISPTKSASSRRPSTDCVPAVR